MKNQTLPITRSIDEVGLICFELQHSHGQSFTRITCWDNHPGASVRVVFVCARTGEEEFVGEVEAANGSFPHGAEALGRRLARIVQSNDSCGFGWRLEVERELAGAGEARFE